jgi:hypothetical protein
MKTSVLVFAALAMVAILAIPRRGDPGTIKNAAWIGEPTARIISWRAPDKLGVSDANAPKDRIAPIQAQVSVVGLALGR